MFDERETNEPALPAELAAFEQRLAATAPSAPRVDRDRLMFAAGAASAQPGRLDRATYPPGRLGYIAEPSWLGAKFWPAATATMTAATVLLAAMLLWPRDAAQKVAVMPSDVDVVVAKEAAEPIVRPVLPPRPDFTPPGYLGVRYVALTQGVGALDEESSPSSASNGDVRPPATSRELLEELLPKRLQSRS